MNKITTYVAGFMFNPALNQVALIRKNKPEWQKGKLNGIGGKIETDIAERPGDAMSREFQEETGMFTRESQWKRFLEMSDGSNFTVHFFAAVGDLSELKSPEDEKVEILNLTEIDPLRGDMIENLPWLIPMALDHLQDGRPEFALIHYPQ